jgi:hypothetical protein
MPGSARHCWPRRKPDRPGPRCHTPGGQCLVRHWPARTGRGPVGRQRTHLPATPALDLAYAQALDRARADTRLTAILPGLLDRSDWAPEDNASLLELQSAWKSAAVADLHGQGRITAARALARDVAARRPGHHPGAHRCRPCTPAHGPRTAPPPCRCCSRRWRPIHTTSICRWTRARLGPGRRPSPGLAAHSPKPRRCAYATASRLAARLAWYGVDHGRDKARMSSWTPWPATRRPTAPSCCARGARLQRAQRHYAQASQLFGQALDGMASTPRPQNA